MLKKISLILLIYISIVNNNIFTMTNGESILKFHNKEQLIKLNNYISNCKNNISIEALKLILGFKPDQNPNIDEIEKAYRNLSRKYHPDKNPGDELAELRFQILTSAKDIIKNYSYSYNFTKSNFYSDSNTDNFTESKVINLLVSYDIISFIKNIYVISALCSNNKKRIARAAKIEILSSILNMTPYILKILSNKPQNSIHTTMILSYILINLKFFFKNLEIIKKSETIANYNKENKKDLSKNRYYQYLWLTLNKIIPYIGFADNKSFEKLESISFISELLRKKYLYNIGENSYKTNN